MTELEHLIQAVADWKESVSWIVGGFDCIDEYQNDLGSRQNLQERLDEVAALGEVPRAILDEIEQIDQEFKSATEPSALSVWDCRPAFRYFSANHVEIVPPGQWDRDKFWYYYRWQPDCDLPWREYDAAGYQKAMYGLDFVTMTEAELIEAVRVEVARWDAAFPAGKRKRR